MCRQIDFTHFPPPQHPPTPDIDYSSGVDKHHKNASNKLLHFCPKTSSTAILEDNSLESNYAAHKFSVSICLCASFEDVCLPFMLFYERKSAIFWHLSCVDNLRYWKKRLDTEHWTFNESSSNVKLFSCVFSKKKKNIVSGSIKISKISSSCIEMAIFIRKGNHFTGIVFAASSRNRCGEKLRRRRDSILKIPFHFHVFSAAETFLVSVYLRKIIFYL